MACGSLKLNRERPNPIVSRLSSFLHLRKTAISAVAALVVSGVGAMGQTSSSSSSSSSSSNPQETGATPTPRIALPQSAGSAITLETSEPLFYLSVALNSCGYDNDLAASSPLRAKIRDEVNEQLAASAPARDARDALCGFIREHSLRDKGLN